ncbi:ATP-binding protein [Silvanigrella sp.]|uniref:ATP-binding protein n=1 Tax=Silvanigrella sp. TaxID=2024976 RepID=UPI0037CB4B68
MVKELKDELDYKSLCDLLPMSYVILDDNLVIKSASNQFVNLLNMKRHLIVRFNLFYFFKINLHMEEDSGIENLKLSLDKVLNEHTEEFMDIQKFNIKVNLNGIQTQVLKYWKVSNLPIFDRNKKLNYIIMKIDDVTDSVKLKLMSLDQNKYFLRTRYQTDLKEKIQRSQKMESIGQLAGGISHDINNMLTIVNLNCDIILNSSQNISPVVKKQTEQIKKTSKHAAKLLQQILSFSKKQRVNLISLNINLIIEDIDRMLIRLLPENMQLKKDLSIEIENVLADPAHIEQVILNLIINARDAIGEIGLIKIETSNKEILEDTALGSHFLKAGHYVVLSVIDNGVGMDSNVQARIFEPFFSTKEEGKGTGLGLATIYSIVEQYKGSIVVHSELGKGTTFQIYFPATDLKLNSLQLDEQNNINFEGKEKILVVEDKEELSESISNSLKIFGYDVYLAKNGYEAIEILKNKGNEVKLVITDIIMPLFSGKNLADSIAQLFPEMKIIFLTGHTEDILLRNEFSRDSSLLIEKPFLLKQLLIKIKEVIH